MLAGTLEEFEAEVAGLSVAGRRARLGEFEELRRRLDAATAVVLADLDESQVWREDGHASIHGMLRSGLHWSEAESGRGRSWHGWRPSIRVSRRLLWEAMISVANADAIARLYANPRIADGLESVMGVLLVEAQRSEHDDFKRLPDAGSC